MDRSKLAEFLNPNEFPTIHVVGVGAVGSHVVELLARMGFTQFHIYDFDRVEAKNITNQMFMEEDIGEDKVKAIAKLAKRINPEIKIAGHLKGLQPPYEISNGIIILCVDNIDLRREIVKANRYNPNINAFVDFRMRLTDAQCYFADNSKPYEVDTLLSTMDFTHEEVKDEAVLSACHVELNVIYIVKMITSMGIANLVNWHKDLKYSTTILIDAALQTMDCLLCVPRVKVSKAEQEIDAMLHEMGFSPSQPSVGEASSVNTENSDTSTPF